MIRIDKISKRDIELKGESIIFDSSTRVCVTGRNGRGKTTLLRIIGGVMFPDSGTISVNSKDYAFPLRLKEQKQYLKAIHSEVFYLESSDILYPFFSVQDCISYYCTTSGLDKFQVEMYLEKLFFEEPPSKRISELSLGTKQKIINSLCLASSKPLLVCDEPTIGLDNQSKSVFVDLAMQLKTGIIFSTNDEWLSSKLNNRLVCSDSREVYFEK